MLFDSDYKIIVSLENDVGKGKAHVVNRQAGRLGYDGGARRSAERGLSGDFFTKALSAKLF